MSSIIQWLEAAVRAIPLPLLEVWGQLAFFVGFVLGVFAFGGFTFRLGHGWGLGREQHAWNGRAFLSIPVTFLAIVLTGYLGSFIVLVPGAQTFESLKDLAVLLCIVLFGYPALLTVPFAYGLSDLVEGVPPRYLVAWLPGYFINPTCFWFAYQIFGKAPDFTRAITWLRYSLFVLLFLALEPVLWGHLCAEQFSAEYSYRTITPALVFTTGLTWLLGPFAFLVGLPLARRFGLFWAEIPGHVREVALGRSEPVWESGSRASGAVAAQTAVGLPVRMFILMPFVLLTLTMVGVTAHVTLSGAAEDATRLTARLHEEVAQNIRLELQRYLSRVETNHDEVETAELTQLLAERSVAKDGFAALVQSSGQVVARTAGSDEAVVRAALSKLGSEVGPLETFGVRAQFAFEHVTAKPLSRERWLAQATRVQHRSIESGWILITALPEAFYLAGVRQSSSQSAIVFAFALLLCLALAGLLASVVTAPLRRISSATRAVSAGQTSSRLPVSRLEELRVLTQLFNDMAHQLDVDATKRKRAEAELREHRDHLEQLVKLRTLELERSERRTKGILQNLADGVVTIDAQGIVRGFSAAASKMFGYSEAEVLGKNVAMLMPAAYAQEHDSYIERYVRTGEAKLIGIGREVSGVRKDGSEFPMDLAIAEVGLGDERLFTGVVRDISERKRAEAQLHDAKEQADTASQAKSAFLANMSHEIRTPMNAILGFGQLLARDSGLSASNKDRVAKILKSGNHLLGLINQVLEMSKIEAGHMHIAVAPFDLHEAVTDVLSAMRERIESKGLGLRVRGISQLPRYVRSDVARLRQILFNVVGNAVKFTAHGSISVQMAAHEFGDRWKLEFSVEDTGVGIASSELARVFEPFEQTGSGIAAGNGTGLGVPISREIARCLGGDLKIRSEPGQGTVVDVDLIVDGSSWAEVSGGKVESRRVVPLPPGAPKPVILVVDDQEDNRLVLEELLTSVGFAVLNATDGQDAIDCFRAARPDLVFMDLKMPGIDGAEAARRIRLLDGGSTVPIVILSASVFDAEHASNPKLGCDAFIRKPFREQEIWDVLERHLGIELSHNPSGRAAELDEALDLSDLGEDLRSALREALELGDLDRASELLDALDAGHSNVAQSLRRQLTSFDLDGLLARL